MDWVPLLSKKKYPFIPKSLDIKDKKSPEKYKYKKPWTVDKPLTSAVFIAEARDSTMWTVCGRCGQKPNSNQCYSDLKACSCER